MQKVGKPGIINFTLPKREAIIFSDYCFQIEIQVLLTGDFHQIFRASVLCGKVLTLIMWEHSRARTFQHLDGQTLNGISDCVPIHVCLGFVSISVRKLWTISVRDLFFLFR